MLNVGLIGAGMVSRHHLIGWRSVADRARVVAIADPDADRRHARATEFGIEHVFAATSEMLGALRIDAVDIVAPRQAHAELVRLCAAHGVAIMCQKPLAPSLAEAEALVHDIGSQSRLMVHENWRFRPYYRQIREWLDSGAVGPVRIAAMSLLSSGLLADGARPAPALVRQPFMRDECRMLVNEVLIHHLDVLRFLLGPLTVVSARLARHAEIVGEDTALIQLQARRGALVTLFGSMAVGGYPAASVDRFEIAGGAGSILLQNLALELRGHADDARSYDPVTSYQQSYDGAITHFVEALRSGDAFETDPADNLETLRLVEDVYRLGTCQ